MFRRKVQLFLTAVLATLIALPVNGIPLDIEEPGTKVLPGDFFDNPEWQQSEQFRRIIQLLEQGRIDQARKRLAQHLQQFPESAAGLDLAGLVLLQQGKPADAEMSFREALRLNRDRISARTGLGAALLVQGKLAEANKQLESAIAADPDDPRAYYYLGLLKRRQGDVSAAINHLETYFQLHDPAPTDLETPHLVLAQMLNLESRYQETVDLLSELTPSEVVSPLGANANFLLTSALLEIGSLDAATDRLAALKKSSPEDAPEILIIEASLARAQSETDRARTLLQQVLDRAPSLAPTVHYELARTNFSEGRTDAAVKNLEDAMASAASENLPALVRDLAGLLIANDESARAFEIVRTTAEKYPEQPWFRYFMGELLIRQGNVQESLNVLTSVVEKHPDFSPAHYLVGVIQWNMNRPTKARRSFETATQLTPQDIRPWLAWAGTHNSGDNRKRMQQILQRGIKATSGAPALLYQSAVLDYQMGRVDAATAKYRKILARVPDDLPTINNLALNLAEEKENLPEARDLAQQAYEMAKENPAVLDTYGWVTFQSGDAEKALPFLEKAIAQKPDDGTIHYHLASVYLALNRPKQAASHLEKARQLDTPQPVEDKANQLRQKMN